MKTLNELINRCQEMQQMLHDASFASFVTIDEALALESHMWQVRKIQSQLNDMKGV